MDFVQKLTDFCKEIDCTNKELSIASGVDASLISRIKSGSRTVSSESDTLRKLCEGLIVLSNQKGRLRFSGNIYEQLRDILKANEKKEYEKIKNFSYNMNYLIEQFNISNSHIAKILTVDPSLISHIRRGRRKPSDMRRFIADLSKYLIKYCFGEKHKEFYAEEFGVEAELISVDNFEDLLTDWILRNNKKNLNSITNFLDKLNDFNLEEYIAAIHFNDIHIPKVPFNFPVRKHYYGFEEMRIGTINFLKMVATSKKVGTVTMFSDFTIQKLSEDISFSKKWMFGLAMMIKRGNHINQIHYLDRPFKEIMLGLEAWIPLYMTGQISPYYMKHKTNQTFCHLLFCAPETVVLSGEAISDFEEEGRYLLSNRKEDMDFYNNKSKRLLQTASPLMEIYKKENEKTYYDKQNENSEKPGKRKHILSSPALYTIPDSLMESMIAKSSLSPESKENIIKQTDLLKKRTETVIKNNNICDFLPILSEEEFIKEPLKLQLTDIFEGVDIPYTYNEYMLHIKGMEDYKTGHENYDYHISSERGYKNIQIFIHEGCSVTVAKSNSPNIMFVIKHKQLREAFEVMEFPVRDQ